MSTRFTSRTQLMDYLGAKQRNVVWSWCAVNEHERKVYFSLWADFRLKRGTQQTYLVQGPNWGIDAETGSLSAARKDHDEKLRLVLEEGYEAYGYIVHAKDPKAEPRAIESTSTGFIFRLRVERQADGNVVGHVTGRIDV